MRIPRLALPASGDRILDGGTDQIDTIEEQAEDDIQYDSWDKWRQSSAKVTNDQDVGEQAVQ